MDSVIKTASAYDLVIVEQSKPLTSVKSSSWAI